MLAHFIIVLEPCLIKLSQMLFLRHIDPRYLTRNSFELRSTWCDITDSEIQSICLLLAEFNDTALLSTLM